MKQDIKLNDVVHEQYVKSIEKLPTKLEEKTNLCKVLNDYNESLSRELAKKTKECQVLKVESTKLVEDMRIKIGIDASNASLAIELAKQRKDCKLLLDINAKLVVQSERQHPKSVPNVHVGFEQLTVIPNGEAMPSRDLLKKIGELTVKYEKALKRLKDKESFEAWRQAMKKEFYSGELTEKDDPTFIELFDQCGRFYTIAQQWPKCDYQEDFTVTG
ncbi:hypothetical protein GIB67_005331, partial [Kingdonia uniflora]